MRFSFLLVFFISLMSWSDEFDQMEKAQNAINKTNPFANKAAECTYTNKSGNISTTKWTFSGSMQYSRHVEPNTTMRGDYEVKGDTVLLHEKEMFMISTAKINSEYSFKYKIKNTKNFQMILQILTKGNDNKKTLYNCTFQ